MSNLFSPLNKSSKFNENDENDITIIELKENEFYLNDYLHTIIISPLAPLFLLIEVVLFFYLYDYF